MKVIDLAREIWKYNDSVKLREECYSIFNNRYDLDELDQIIDNKWRILLRRFPVSSTDYRHLLDDYSLYKNNRISQKELFFKIQILCKGVDSQINSLKKEAEKASTELSIAYDRFFDEGIENAIEEEDDIKEALLCILKHPEIKKIFMELLEY